MRFLKSWSTTDQQTLIALSDDVITVLERHILATPLECEAGGLLLRTVHGTHIAVVEVAEPTLSAKRPSQIFRSKAVWPQRDSKKPLARQ
jgi:hypothetical protein